MSLYRAISVPILLFFYLFHFHGILGHFRGYFDLFSIFLDLFGHFSHLDESFTFRLEDMFVARMRLLWRARATLYLVLTIICMLTN